MALCKPLLIFSEPSSRCGSPLQDVQQGWARGTGQLLPQGTTAKESNLEKKRWRGRYDRA